MDDIRTRTGLLNQSDAARFLDIRQQTFNRWARGYEGERPLLHVLPAGGSRQATVPFVAMAEAYRVPDPDHRAAGGRPLAAPTDTAIPARPPESAIREIEAINRLMFDNPAQWAGVWYDKTSDRVVAAVPPGASEQTRASARSATATR